jgi:hypothetical protein
MTVKFPFDATRAALPRLRLFGLIPCRPFIDRISLLFLNRFIFALVRRDSPLGVAGGNPNELAVLERRCRRQTHPRRSVF